MTIRIDGTIVKRNILNVGKKFLKMYKVEEDTVFSDIELFIASMHQLKYIEDIFRTEDIIRSKMI